MRIRKKYLFYVLALTSAFAYAAAASLDGFVSYKFIKDPWVLCLSFFLIGVIITFFITLILSLPIKGKSIGSKIDPSFRRLRLLRKEEIKYQLLSSIGNAVSTIGYYFIVSMFVDSSVVLSFSQLVIIYLLVTESVAEKNAPTLAEIQSSVIVAFGAMLGSISLSGEVRVDALLIVFLVINPAWVLFASYQRKLKLLKIEEKPNDSINIRFWNLLFTTIFVSAIVFLINKQLFFDSLDAMRSSFSWLSLGAVITFFSVVLFIRAMGIGKASITQAVRASSIIFTIPFIYILSYFVPTITFVTDPVMLLIKLMGIILVVLGVISFALTEIRAYVFINAKGGYSIKELMQKIWAIKGVDSVAALAGSYDIIAKIRIRTLGKGYERIIRKLEEIDGIWEFKWQSILKEWEEI
ncbi:MAG: Lrp/AsnC family transcriptional regulator [Thermoplasmata archaeon]|nr:MAG: Lrp/AsnC family transcriptional regulator [Thermoplasmata archaeon]